MLAACNPEGYWRRERWANSGGPASRTRKVRIASSLLGQEEGNIRCPRLIHLGLRFPDGVDPVAYTTALLNEQGHGHPEELRDRFAPPERPYVCRAAPPGSPRLDVTSASVEETLGQALLLGLCTAHRYDPLRSVLWTQASLTRALELFDPTGFYA